jgi:NodT family efflux transporter outer membrane factor (OMF) lipoprotein
MSLAAGGNRIRVLAALFAASALAGCTTLGPDFQAPAPPPAGGYLAPGEAASREVAVKLGSEAAADWWTAFRSPELDALVRQAYAGNPSLAAAKASLVRARELARSEAGRALPAVDSSASAQRERLNFTTFGLTFPGFPTNADFSLYSVGATASYPLDLFGGERRKIEGARAQAEAQAHELDAAYLTLAGQVASEAAVLAALKAEIAAVDQIIADDRRNLELVRKAEAAGSEPRSAQVSAESQLAADETLAPPLRQQQAVARHALALLLGKAPADWTAPDFALEALTLPREIPVSLPSQLVRQRPDILAAEARLHAATAAIGASEAEAYPNVSLSAGMTQSALEPQNLFHWTSSAYNVGPGVSLPLFHGFAVKHATAAARAEAEAARAQYEATVLRAFGQVADLMQALAHDEEQLDAEARAEASAERGLSLARLAYQAGGTGLFPVIDASRQLNNARLGLARARAQRYLDAIQLFVAAGRGMARAGAKAGG